MQSNECEGEAVIPELLAKHGIGAKFVRAYCKAMGWRYDAQGVPAQWYAAWRNGLADDIGRSLLAKERGE